MNEDASTWIDNNYEGLVKEFNNKWVGATAEGVKGSGQSFDVALEDIKSQEIPVSEVVFIYLTNEVIQ
ncbi:MAG: hypothetical protein WD431_16185 [Cyclobacteriaceae bacterium]